MDEGSVMDISDGLFKDVMSRLVSGVSIISSRDNNGRLFGFTATSLTSVSLRPSLLLFCVNSFSHTLGAIRETGVFSISMLSEQDDNISNHFASNNPEKFCDFTKYSLGAFSNCPIISTSHSAIECSLHAEYDGGDHRIVVGIVENAVIMNDNLPLSYYKRGYRKLDPYCAQKL